MGGTSGTGGGSAAKGGAGGSSGATAGKGGSGGATGGTDTTGGTGGTNTTGGTGGTNTTGGTGGTNATGGTGGTNTTGGAGGTNSTGGTDAMGGAGAGGESGDGGMAGEGGASTGGTAGSAAGTAGTSAGTGGTTGGAGAGGTTGGAGAGGTTGGGGAGGAGAGGMAGTGGGGPVNLITDGDFEAGKGAWGGWGTDPLVVDTTIFHGGAQSLLATNMTSGSAIARDILSVVTAGSMYTATAWVRVTTATSPLKFQLVQACDSAADSYPVIQWVQTPTADTWTQVTGTIDLSACTAVDKALLFVGHDDGSAYVDDVSLVLQQP